MLKRTQIYFPEDMLFALKKRAYEEKTNVSNVIRKAISYFLLKEKKRDWVKDSLWNMVGAGSSKDKDLSISHDKYLYGK
ncbi:MAG: CopG family transcriptional regulator [bacterium]